MFAEGVPLRELGKDQRRMLVKVCISLYQGQSSPSRSLDAYNYDVENEMSCALDFLRHYQAELLMMVCEYTTARW
jgi:hypothetical protein